jgi:hypothetical protein
MQPKILQALFPDLVTNAATALLLVEAIHIIYGFAILISGLAVFPNCASMLRQPHLSIRVPAVLAIACLLSRNNFSVSRMICALPGITIDTYNLQLIYYAATEVVVTAPLAFPEAAASMGQWAQTVRANRYKILRKAVFFAGGVMTGGLGMLVGITYLPDGFFEAQE